MRQAEQPTLALPERRIIERPRLLKQLEESDARTILLVAPAGYGKTTLARQWARGEVAAWYTANLGSADIAALARGLAQSLKEHAPDLPMFVQETLSAMRNPAKEVRALTEVFVDRLRDAREIVLVVDDHHALDGSPASEQLVAALVQSGSTRMLVASRSRPRWAKAREYLYGEVLELGRRDLGFDESETVELVRGRRIPRDMLARADGWPAVLGLITRAGGLGAPPPELIAQTLYDYLAEESFNSALPETQEALLAISLLPTLTPQAIEETFGADATSVAHNAACTGLVDFTRHGAELHPLARMFLFDRLRGTPDVDSRAREAIAKAIRLEAWDEAFAFIEAFQIYDALDELMTSAFSPLLSIGRVETLERYAEYALAKLQRSTPITSLVEAEVAFRDGLLAEAQSLAVSAAEEFPAAHPLKARGYNLAGAAALVRFDLLAESHRLHSLARGYATSPQDRRDAVWGQCLALIYLEDEGSADAAQQLTRISRGAPEDRVRAATAQLLVRRQRQGFRGMAATLAARDVLGQVRDPRVRTSFGNVCAYILGLQGRYDEAATLVDTSITDAEKYNLSFAKPHLYWTKAFASLGLRRFSEAQARLRSVEEFAREAGSDHLELNVRTLRSRMMIVQQRTDEALEATSIHWKTIPTRAMYGEYLATRALALATAGETQAARRTIAESRGLTSVVEVQTLTSATEAILAHGTRSERRAGQRALDLALHLDTWDALICAFRARPGILHSLLTEPTNHRSLGRALRLSNDYGLLRSSGLPQDRPYGSAGLLSRREREVIDLIRQGLKNREIARTLYISEATAKVHVRHVLEKLGARSRAEAVAIYATAEAGSPASGSESG